MIVKIVIKVAVNVEAGKQSFEALSGLAFLYFYVQIILNFHQVAGREFLKVFFLSNFTENCLDVLLISLVNMFSNEEVPYRL